MIRGTWKPRDDNKGQETETEEKESMEMDSESGDEEGEEEEGNGTEEERQENSDGEDVDEGEEGEETPKARYNDGTNARSPATSPKPPSPRQVEHTPVFIILRTSRRSGAVDELTLVSTTGNSVRTGR
ncbi:hypothetical protein JVU11DRAFT_6662 [Chiua virens]|nr:hypothetical protein JVU11DRAFT_6662 [Chiua virens]